MVGSAPNSDCNWFYIKSVRVGSPLVANCEVILDENISMVRAPASRFYLIGNKVDRSAERVCCDDVHALEWVSLYSKLGSMLADFIANQLHAYLQGLIWRKCRSTNAKHLIQKSTFLNLYKYCWDIENVPPKTRYNFTRPGGDTLAEGACALNRSTRNAQKVEKEAGEALAREHNMEFFETSAKVTLAFSELAMDPSEWYGTLVAPHPRLNTLPFLGRVLQILNCSIHFKNASEKNKTVVQ